MVDSNTVLWGQTIMYTAYALAILAVMGWFARRITREGRGTAVKPGLFWAFFAFLVVVGVSLHIVTYNTIPWAPLDANRAGIQPDKVFRIAIENHRFELPAATLSVDCNDKVLFEVSSADLTYGFGLFKRDNSMLFQMQVVPGHRNDILWEFRKDGVYTIRSTEYSGPKGIGMIAHDAVEVTGCRN